MSDLRTRVIKSFSVAFPDLPESAIPTATPETFEAWDSIGSINLASVLEEEFAIAVDLERLPELNSFDAVMQYVQRELAQRAAPERG